MQTRNYFVNSGMFAFRKLFFSVLLMFVATAVTAQTQKTFDLTTLRGWEHSEATGDLDKDGKADLVIIATPDFKEHIVTEGERSINYNQPILAIFRGTGTGGFTPWKQYDNVIPARPDEYVFIDYEVTVNERGVIRIMLNTWLSAGSYGTNNHTYVFRYQDNDFYLIGEDDVNMMRNTGELETDSYNYLTNRHQHVVDNAMKKVKPREKWTKIPAKPLRRLGTWSFDED